ncbi:AMP-binding protein [Desulfovibrio subterraneus]|jgi:fatty-acyl-CoA synthase|uniref:AMP-binding protein n=1 Tax=Desulfovibrio subterraneus TaxID=2718620 RepID=A0A7J0BH54_9BACT|nr:AMP-binding protein [Desulfovibrio subterraneus]WBF66803.1 AMP-binding protein [Desulfovibrio subterraneus]GFM32521.1 AMP-binding protein [Desulfovibrio subterraneus]
MEQFEIREKTLGQILDETIAKYPDNDAVIYVDRDYRLTYKQFGAVVDDLARGLMALGVQHGEKVAVWSTNVPYWVALQFATAKIGAVLLTINTNYRKSELQYLLTQSECENLFIMDGFRDHDYVQTIFDIIPELKTQPRGKLQCESLPHLKRVMFLGVEKHRGMYSVPEIMAMKAMCTEQEYLERQQALSPHDVVNMQYTSGTTGFPKGVMLSHLNIGLNGYWIGRNQNFTSKDRLCLPVPLFHCFGCVLGVLAAVNHGAALVILESFSPVHVMASIDQEKCTALYGVPTMFLAVLEHKIFDKFDYSSLRTGIMAGSVCPAPLMRRVIEKMNMREITICYGLTEGSPVMTQTLCDESFERRTQTVGRHMPGIEVMVMDPETGEECPRGVQGEVVCRGYNVMKGYYNMPEATEKAVDPQGWLHSGDLGTMDEEGYVVITGRIKDMIIRGGENIYPREIEEFLYGMPAVQDVQVVGVPSRKYGEEVGAFIIPKEGCEVTPEDIRDFCRGQIAWHKVPRHIAFVTEYPMTASGKIQKFKLREMAGELFPEAMK